jgi:very-short-patch-repair endonuclease
MAGVERLLWSRLRRRQEGGLKFRRQVPLGPYVVNFSDD